jgi:hypothetical protein
MLKFVTYVVLVVYSLEITAFGVLGVWYAASRRFFPKPAKDAVRDDPLVPELVRTPKPRSNN